MLPAGGRSDDRYGVAGGGKQRVCKGGAKRVAASLPNERARINAHSGAAGGCLGRIVEVVVADNRIGMS